MAFAPIRSGNCSTTAWGNDALLHLSTVHTALGGSINIPMGWRIQRDHACIAAHAPNAELPDGLPAFEWRCEAARPAHLRGLMFEQTRWVELRGARVSRRTTIETPRHALVIDFDYASDGGPLSGRRIAAPLDDGRVLASITCLGFARDAEATEFAAARLWRLSALTPPLVPRGWRRFVNERAGLQCAAPETWRIDHDSDTLLALRVPGDAREHPTFVVQSDFDAGRARSAADAAAGLSGISIEMDIGNRPGIAVQLQGIDGRARGQLLHLFVPEPTARASHVIQCYAGPGESALIAQLCAHLRWCD
jgi:hypothetical protein